jgi:hypothetical protein
LEERNTNNESIQGTEKEPQTQTQNHQTLLDNILKVHPEFQSKDDLTDVKYSHKLKSSLLKSSSTLPSTPYLSQSQNLPPSSSTPNSTNPKSSSLPTNVTDSLSESVNGVIQVLDNISMMSASVQSSNKDVVDTIMSFIFDLSVVKILPQSVNRLTNEHWIKIFQVLSKRTSSSSSTITSASMFTRNSSTEVNSSFDFSASSAQSPKNDHSSVAYQSCLFVWKTTSYHHIMIPPEIVDIFTKVAYDDGIFSSLATFNSFVDILQTQSKNPFFIRGCANTLLDCFLNESNATTDSKILHPFVVWDMSLCVIKLVQQGIEIFGLSSNPERLPSLIKHTYYRDLVIKFSEIVNGKNRAENEEGRKRIIQIINVIISNGRVSFLLIMKIK